MRYAPNRVSLQTFIKHTRKMKNIAIILAGGIGSRLNAGMPKQFLKIAGMSVIEHTINVFQKHNRIDEIAVVVNNAYRGKIESYIIKNHFTKVKRYSTAGRSAISPRCRQSARTRTKGSAISFSTTQCARS